MSTEKLRVNLCKSVLATYTGLSPGPVTSPCIATSTGSVQLRTDSIVVDQGFIVDSVVPC